MNDMIIIENTFRIPNAWSNKSIIGVFFYYQVGIFLFCRGQPCHSKPRLQTTDQWPVSPIKTVYLQGVILKMCSVRLSLFLFLLVGHLALMADAGLVGLAVYGVCQSGCNAAWVACVAAAGGTAGVSTGRIWRVLNYLKNLCSSLLTSYFIM